MFDSRLFLATFLMVLGGELIAISREEVPRHLHRMVSLP
jgi:hypothetical protein